MLDAMAALAEPTRARIVGALADGGELTVNEIVERFSLTQPSISRHLKILREAGLTRVRADGRQRFYRLDPAPLREIDRWLDQFRSAWANRLDALEHFMDEGDTDE